MAVQKWIIENFLGGLAPSRYVGDPSSQYDPGSINSPTSGGWDPTIQDDVGLLRRGYQGDTITNVSTFNGNVQWAKSITRTNLGQYLFLEGQDDSLSANRLYRIDLSTNTVTPSGTFPRTLPGTYGVGTGLEIFNGYLWYASGRYLGRYDLSTTFNDSFNISLSTIGLGDSINHPMIQGNGKLFIGNANTNGGAVITSVDASSVVNLTALDLSQTDQIVQALEFDRNYLFIGMTGNTTQGSNLKAESALIIWDTTSGSWQERYRFPEERITAIKAFNGNIFVWGRRGFYRFAGGSFELIQEINGGPSPHGVDVSSRGILYFGSADGVIYGYGSPSPRQIPSLVFRPYSLSAVYSGFLAWVNAGNLYLGGFQTADFVRRFSSSGATAYSSAEWRTPMRKFEDMARLVRVKVYFLPLTSGTTVDVKWAKDDGSSTTTLGTISEANSTSWDYQPNGLVGDAWQIVLNHTAGATPKIKKIEIEYQLERD